MRQPTEFVYLSHRTLHLSKFKANVLRFKESGTPGTNSGGNLVAKSAAQRAAELANTWEVWVGVFAELLELASDKMFFLDERDRQYCRTLAIRLERDYQGYWETRDRSRKHGTRYADLLKRSIARYDLADDIVERWTLLLAIGSLRRRLVSLSECASLPDASAIDELITLIYDKHSQSLRADARHQPFLFARAAIFEAELGQRLERNLASDPI